MPSRQWSQPELSVGERHGSMDVLGIYKCWSIKDKSPAQLVWKNVSRAIVALLEDQFEHLDAEDEDLMVEMFMIGRKLATCSPTILFSCECKTSRQRAMDLVQKRRILAPYPGVLMAECARLPRLLATDKLSGMELSTGVYANEDLRHCGISVLVVGYNGGPPRKATIGGMVRIGDEHYGLTANHPFSKALGGEENDEPDTEFAFYGLGEPDGDGSDNEIFSAERTSQGSASSNSTRSQTSDDWNSGQDSPLVACQEELLGDKGVLIEPSESTDPQITQTQLPHLIGHFFEAPPRNQGLDWALVKLHWGSLIRQANAKSLELIKDILMNNFKMQSRAERWINVATEPRDCQVLIATGTSGVLLEGRLSPAPSFKKSVGSRKFLELWTVTCQDGNFFDGDCGSWVMDGEDSILYGQVVAGYPGTKTAYIIPMAHIIEDIERLVWPVKIPTSLPKWVQALGDEGDLGERMKTVLERSNESKSLSFSGRSKSVSGPSTTKPEPLVAAEHRQIRNENEDFLSRNEGPRRLQISKGSESPFSPSKTNPEMVVAAIPSSSIIASADSKYQAYDSQMNQNNAAPGPIPATTPLIVRQDNNGVQWIAFKYSRDRVKMEYTIRCDVESVNVDTLTPEFKTENCVYPRACGTTDQYRGNRLVYETECNTVGWALAELNPCLRGKRGLIQRAVDSWRNSNQDPRLRSRRIRRIRKINNRKAVQAHNVPHMAGPSGPTGMPPSGGIGKPSLSGMLSETDTQSFHHNHLDGSNQGGDNVGVDAVPGLIQPPSASKLHRLTEPPQNQSLRP